MQIFISYSSKDNIEAFKVCEYLEQNGVSCFIAPRNIQPGKEYGEEIINGIDGSRAMVLLLSNFSNKSPHVLREVERAVSKGMPIYVYSLEQVELTKSMEYFLMSHQWGSMDTKLDFAKILDWVQTLDKEQPTVAGERGAHRTTGKEAERTKKKSIGAKLIGVIAGLLVVLVLCVGLFLADDNRVAKVVPGDTIVLGNYNGEPIEWRVLKVDGKQAVLVSKDILTMKAYDAAEGGRYNYVGNTDYWTDSLEGEPQLQVQVRGNSDWSVSNIRTWLNSDKEVVTYADQAPGNRAMVEGRNGYDNEPGFLFGFSEEELEAIVETSVITRTNVLAEDETITTTDRVYLLSLDELVWFEEAGVSKLAEPTEAAMVQDESDWYEIEKDGYGVEAHYWWLRDAVAEAACKGYVVSNGYWEEEILPMNVGYEGYGIRPAITVDLSSDYLWEMLGIRQ